ncbi:unnamed protein product [Nezara viridula]|uniref:Neuropeptide n=1 Tax=Nezara viridula TaxID=85310 RepID=A0A9P0HGM6_NEZVI|nr:unnamed protein product [Nezara viridula]
MTFKALIFLAACLAVASATLITPYVVGGDDGSYWRGKYDLREFHAALPSVRGGIWAYPYAQAYAHLG